MSVLYVCMYVCMHLFVHSFIHEMCDASSIMRTSTVRRLEANGLNHFDEACADGRHLTHDKPC